MTYKIGMLLGSFDPPHIGHLYAAQYALNKVDEVHIVPAWHNPWKQNQTSYEHRINMCERMFRKKNMFVSRADSIVKSEYTFQFLKEILKNNYLNHEYYIIGGTDTCNEIQDWKEGQWILDNFRLIEVPRAGYTDIANGIECSSTMIRETKEYEKYTNKRVAKYINKHKLYEDV